MDSTRLNNWIQIVGLSAVVASLIFVGLQMRQTQAIAIANQYQDRAALNIAGRHAHLQNNTLLELRGKDLLEQLSDPSIRAFFEEKYGASAPLAMGYTYMSDKTTYLMMDNNHFQYESGFLTEDTWHAYRSELKAYLMDRYFLYIWDDTRDQYRAEFQTVVDQLILENGSEL